MRGVGSKRLQHLLEKTIFPKKISQLCSKEFRAM